MTSLMCAPRFGGVLEVYNDDLVEELVIDGNDHIKTMYLSRAEALRRKAKLKRPSSTPNPNQRHAVMNTSALIGHTLKLQDWLNERSVKSVQEKADVQAKNTKKMYTSVLETENTFVKELGEFLEHKEMLDLRKKEMLHKRWTEQVYEPIRRQVDREMNGPNYDELCMRKRQLHKEYLEHVNRKGHVFLDTYAPDEYYPLALHPVRPSPLVAETKPLADPLLSQERERNEEDRTIIRCQTGAMLSDRDLAQIRLPPLPLVPLGRHGTECNTWLSMPMGDIESPVRLASRRRMQGIYNNSQINFDKWSKFQYNSNLHNREMKTQKRRAYSGTSNPRQVTINQVIHEMENDTPQPINSIPEVEEKSAITVADNTAAAVPETVTTATVEVQT